MAKVKKQKASSPASTRNPIAKFSAAHAKNIAKPSKSQQPSRSNDRSAIKPTIPFEAEDRILLVGEGDFSFTRSIIEEHGCCDITATCFDSKDELSRKYDPQGPSNVKFIEEDEGQTVLYSVDATRLDAQKQLKRSDLYDRVLFNFPHVGGKSKDVNRQVRFNQDLLVNFFKSAANLLAANGLIVVTLFEGEPYTLWNVRDLARHSGLEVVRSFRFVPEVYPGYRHARTLGNLEGGGGWKGEERESRSYCFGKKEGNAVRETKTIGKKRKRGGGESSDDE